MYETVKQNLTVEIRVVCHKVALPSLLYQIWVFGESFSLTPFQDFLKRHPIFPLLVGQLFRGLCNFICWSWQTCHLTGQIALPFDSWGRCSCCQSSWMGNHKGRCLGGMAKRVAKDVLSISNWRGHISTPQAFGGKPAGPSHRWLGRIGSLSPPPLWPPFLGTACCHYVIVGWCRHDPHRWSPPL